MSCTFARRRTRGREHTGAGRATAIDTPHHGCLFPNAKTQAAHLSQPAQATMLTAGNRAQQQHRVVKKKPGVVTVFLHSIYDGLTRPFRAVPKPVVSVYKPVAVTEPAFARSAGVASGIARAPEFTSAVLSRAPATSGVLITPTKYAQAVDLSRCVDGVAALGSKRGGNAAAVSAVQDLAALLTLPELSDAHKVAAIGEQIRTLGPHDALSANPELARALVAVAGPAAIAKCTCPVLLSSSPRVRGWVCTLARWPPTIRCAVDMARRSRLVVSLVTCGRGKAPSWRQGSRVGITV